ncbi:MAG: ATP-binding protein [Spirochaetes bacterium]|nr:ATP-binding protein [Spirochaetota bacterium]
MKLIDKIKNTTISKSRLQDVIFIVGILAFSIILVLGLFPKTDPEVIPITAAIYFIIISFKRKLYSETSEISSSITFKIGLAFVFVAILSSLPILIISNNIINETISQFVNNETISTFEESLEMAQDSIQECYFNIERELISLEYSLNSGTITMSPDDRKYLSNIYRLKGFQTIYYRILKNDYYTGNILKTLGNAGEDPQLLVINKFLNNINIENGYSIHNISVNKESVLLGKLYYNSSLIVIYMKIPQKVYNRIAIYKNSLSKYNREDFLKPYFRMGIGIVLLIIAIIVILVAISLGFFLSRNITRPVLELVEAAGSVASGNFDIRLKRDSSDELALLFNSFNQMISQLDESKKMTFQTQKLEDLENVIITGTDTIIEEVSVLTMMLAEFSRFARLPEMKREKQGINPVIENCINSFAGHEKITFEYSLDNKIPDLFIDKILMRQAFINILQNAVEASGETGHITVKTEFIIEESRKKARISIRDHGTGIKNEYLGRIFDPTFTTKESGSGIGLAIVNKIILEHNGRIFCNSEWGKGTEFIIDLPIQ